MASRRSPDFPTNQLRHLRHYCVSGTLDAAAFSDLIRAVDNWRPEIFNYFDTPVTNAITEALNGMAKIANRLGRGYSFEAIRAKMLFGPSKITGQIRPSFGANPMSYSGCFYGEYKGELGVPLTQILELFNDSH